MSENTSENEDARPSRGDERLQVLNLYAGLGGNRKLWPDTVDVTAVEIHPDIAAYYAEQFPEDEVIVADAHEYLKENHEQFDYVWSSCPCQTHSRVSRMAWVSDAPQNADRDPEYPDMRLYQEILFLDHFFEGDWAVENVISYYTPLVEPQTVGTHYIWSNYHIPEFDSEVGPGAWTNPPMEKFEEFLGFDLSGCEFKGERKDQLLRNCVDPKIGKHVFESRSKQEKLPIRTDGGARPEDGDDQPPSELTREEKRAVYGTLNPGLQLMTSSELKAEVDRIVESSAAGRGQIIKAHGDDHATVELRFRTHTAGVELGVFDDGSKHESDDAPEDDALIGVQSARHLLSDFEDVDTEMRHGAIEHAIAELRNARRALPDDY